jgi:hypothetical protein
MSERGSDRWITCPKCRRRMFRWTGDGIEVAPGARIMQPMDRGTDEWVTRADEVAIAQCPRGHMAGPPQ